MDSVGVEGLENGGLQFAVLDGPVLELWEGRREKGKGVVERRLALCWTPGQRWGLGGHQATVWEQGWSGQWSIR